MKNARKAGASDEEIAETIASVKAKFMSARNDLLCDYIHLKIIFVKYKFWS